MNRYGPALSHRMRSGPDRLRQEWPFFTRPGPSWRQRARFPRTPPSRRRANHFPLPDDSDRRRLIALYTARQTLTEDTIDEVVRRTDGAAPAFIKELLRRAILQAELRESGAAAERRNLDGALDELLAASGVLSRRLLGAHVDQYDRK